MIPRSACVGGTGGRNHTEPRRRTPAENSWASTTVAYTLNASNDRVASETGHRQSQSTAVSSTVDRVAPRALTRLEATRLPTKSRDASHSSHFLESCA